MCIFRKGTLNLEPRSVVCPAPSSLVLCIFQMYDWTQFEKLGNIVNSEIRLAKQAIIKTALTNIQAVQGRPGRRSMNLLYVNLEKQR